MLFSKVIIIKTMENLRALFGVVVMIIGAIPITFFLSDNAPPIPNYFLYVGIIVFIAGGLIVSQSKKKDE